MAATGAPTRVSIGRTTSTIRSRSAISAWTTSPARTFVDGLAGLPLTRTCPPSHSWVAIGRVLTSRTAHNQRSIRVSSDKGFAPCRRASDRALFDDAASVAERDPHGRDRDAGDRGKELGIEALAEKHRA